MADHFRLNKKIGRNEKCWCGSGKKYKHCHLGREKASPPKLSDIIKHHNKTFNKKTCLCPDGWKTNCDGAIVKAHTVSKKMLKKIADSGHVYGLVKDLGALVRNDGQLIFEKIGIQKASTFTGFCEKHDREIFKPIENKPFVITEEHMFLLAYRALSYEIFTKKAALENIPFMHQMDAGKTTHEQFALQEFVKSCKLGFEAGMKDMRFIKASYDNILISKEFSKIKYYVVRIADLPCLMYSGCIYPTFDFHGNRLQKLACVNLKCEGISVSIIANDENEGMFVFAWIGKDNGPCDKFIHSFDILSPYAKAQAIIRFGFEFIENKYLNIGWWDDLDANVKDALNSRQHSATSFSSERKEDCLADDGLHYVDWEILDCYTNIKIN